MTGGASVCMEDVIARWPSETQTLRERWFRGGTHSALWIGCARAKRAVGGEVVFRWIYTWMDMGMWHCMKKRVRIMQVSRNMCVVNRKIVCHLDGLESACFGGVRGECEALVFAELGVLPV